MCTGYYGISYAMQSIFGVIKRRRDHILDGYTSELEKIR
jgi:hypothetical protein